MAGVYTIALYLVTREFGGREEGGWYYDAGQLRRVVRTFRTGEQAYNYNERLNRKLDSRKIGPNQGRRSYTSVLGTGEYHAHVYEPGEAIPAYFPERRPHYE